MHARASKAQHALLPEAIDRAVTTRMSKGVETGCTTAHTFDDTACWQGDAAVESHVGAQHKTAGVALVAAAESDAAWVGAAQMTKRGAVTTRARPFVQPACACLL